MNTCTYNDGHAHTWIEYQSDGPNASAYIPARFKCTKCNFTLDSASYSQLMLLNEITSWQKWVPIGISIFAIFVSIGLKFL